MMQVIIVAVASIQLALLPAPTSGLPPTNSSASSVAASNRSASNVVGGQLRIGYLVTEVAPPFRWGAINLALRQGQADGLLPGFNFSIMYNMTTGSCDVKSGMLATVDLLDADDVDVLFGPTCSTICSSNGYLTSAWNVPQFPEYCGDPTLDDKTTYNTIVRIGGSWSGLGTAFSYIMKTYGWRRVAILTDTALAACYYGGTAINNLLSTMPNITVTYIRMDSSSTSPSSNSNYARHRISSYLSQVKSNARIMQQLLFAAQDANMTSNEYAWFTFYAPTNVTSTVMPWTAYNMSGQDSDYRKQAFYAVKQVTFQDFSGPNATDFLTKVRLASMEAPWYIKFTLQPSIWAAWLYDAVYLFMKIADKMIRSGFKVADLSNGVLVFRQSFNTQFNGLTGNVLIDQNGDRISTYTVWTFGSNQSQYIPYMRVDLTAQITAGSQIVSVFAPATWGLLDSDAPADSPVCGFNNELCPPPDYTYRIIIGGSFAGAFLLIALFVGQYIRARRAESKIQQMLWKIDCSELIYNNGANSNLSMILGSKLNVSVTSIPVDEKLSTSFQPSNCKIATFRSNAVMVYAIDKMELNLTRRDLVALINLKELSHENIKTFVGACIVPGHMCYVMNLCSRGTLQDVIEDSDIKLDWLFRVSLISDLISGMLYLHKSMFQSHGRLTSANCHIDSRWVLKISGFGLDAFYNDGNAAQVGDHAYYRELLWTAPELLRMKKRPLNGTQKGDVYSFAIIVQEIAYRAQPYFCDNIDPQIIVERVSDDSPPYYRPTPHAEVTEMPTALEKMMTQCWSELPIERPTFDDVLKIFRQVNKGKKIDIVSNMLQKLEKYANNLEDLVRQRTCELEEEKQKTDMLLNRMLPRSIADELKAGRPVVPELYASTTIYFSDIVGFTTLSSQSTPMEVVALLNDLYGTFDDTISRHDVYKVETIGDAYMVVSGLPKPNEGRHIREICNMALNLLDEVNHFVIRHRPGEKLRLRIGIHTGPCAAGVVGHAMPRYCLFGDTVNVASRMESTGEALRIHMSESAHKAITAYEEYITELRGETFVKGKGMLPTFWLLGKKEIVLEVAPVHEEQTGTNSLL